MLNEVRTLQLSILPRICRMAGGRAKDQRLAFTSTSASIASDPAISVRLFTMSASLP